MTDKVSVIIATQLRGEVEKMIQTDPNMRGIARYLASVEIFWSSDIETACAGHGFIFFNPLFWAELPLLTRNTIMAHEVWHLILKHLERGVGFDPYDYNVAGDHVINNLLEDDGFQFDFTGMTFRPCKDAKYKSMSTEEVYEIVHEDRKKKAGDPPPPCDGGKGGEADDPTPTHVPKSVIDDLVKAAADAIAGDDKYTNVPDQVDKDDKKLKDLQISLGGITGHEHIKLDVTNTRPAIKDATYEQIFAEYLIDPISGAKRSFMRPNRRMHGMKADFTLPGRVKRQTKSNRLAHLIYCLDVSGSITDVIRQQFHDSVRTIKELLNPNLLTVILWDTEIKLIKTFTEQEKYGKIEVEAGGCTSLDKVYRYIRTRNPDAVVIFTDLCVIIPPEPSWKTIWLVPERHKESNVPGIYGDIYIMPK